MPDQDQVEIDAALTAANVIWGLQKTLDRAKDKILDLEDFQDRVRRSDGQLKNEFDRQIKAHETAYSQCETYLLNTRVQLDAKADALEEAEARIKVLEENPPFREDLISANTIGVLQIDIRRVRAENDVLRAAGQTYVDELAKAQAKIAEYEKVRDLQADAIDRLNERIKEEAMANHYSWKQKYDELLANPLIVQNFCPTCGQPDNCGDCDHTVVVDTNALRTEVEGLKAVLYSIRYAANEMLKEKRES